MPQARPQAIDNSRGLPVDPLLEPGKNRPPFFIVQAVVSPSHGHEWHNRHCGDRFTPHIESDQLIEHGLIRDAGGGTQGFSLGLVRFLFM